MPKISVIVPAYNCEQFLGETLDCLLNQTIDDIEVIIVNDGSTDSTAEVINEYSLKSSIFKVITQENAGVSAARNNGLDAATGEYVVFLDADDIYTPGSLEAFYNAATETGADIVLGRLRNFSENGMGKFNRFADSLSHRREISNFAKILLWNFLIGNKCYRREALVKSGVRFPGFRYSEEGAFFMRFVFTGAKITGTPGACMCYRRHTDEQGLSVSQTVSRENCESMIGSLTDIYNHAVKAVKSAPADVDREDYLQEVIYKTAYILISQFYRLVWRGDAECFEYAAKQFVHLRDLMTDKRFKVICGTDRDLHLDKPCMTLEDIAKHPNASIIVKPFTPRDMSLLIDSLYNQISPLFQLIVPQALIDCGGIPEHHLDKQNLTVLPDKKFVPNAKKVCASKRRLILRTNKPLDVRTLRMPYRITQIPEGVKDAFYPVMIRGINFLLTKRIVK